MLRYVPMPMPANNNCSFYMATLIVAKGTVNVPDNGVVAGGRGHEGCRSEGSQGARRGGAQEEQGEK